MVTRFLHAKWKPRLFEPPGGYNQQTYGDTDSHISGFCRSYPWAMTSSFTRFSCHPWRMTQQKRPTQRVPVIPKSLTLGTWWMSMVDRQLCSMSSGTCQAMNQPCVPCQGHMSQIPEVMRGSYGLNSTAFQTRTLNLRGSETHTQLCARWQCSPRTDPKIIQCVPGTTWASGVRGGFTSSRTVFGTG